jgi:hypothetical protein
MNNFDSSRKNLTYILNGFLGEFFVLNATFSNISSILWWPVLVVEEARVPYLQLIQAYNQYGVGSRPTL